MTATLWVWASLCNIEHIDRCFNSSNTQDNSAKGGQNKSSPPASGNGMKYKGKWWDDMMVHRDACTIKNPTELLEVKTPLSPMLYTLTFLYFICSTSHPLAPSLPPFLNHLAYHPSLLPTILYSCSFLGGAKRPRPREISKKKKLSCTIDSTFQPLTHPSSLCLTNSPS